VLTTQGRLLAGQVLYSQPQSGFRSGIEPVLLAASIPARPGDAVLEAGTGAGPALLCLAARVGEIHALGVEIDAALAALAAANAHANGFRTIEIITGAIEDIAMAGRFDHAMANPPYHAPEGSVSPVLARETAKRGSAGLLRVWVGAMARSLRHRGSLTLILPAGMITACLSAMADSGCPCTALFPLWPKAGRAAKLALLRGVRNARTPMQVMSGLVLHRPDGSFTQAAAAILDGQATIPLHC
jgi:tRNA1Val (adenine37-N6)-methyltransferase